MIQYILIGLIGACIGAIIGIHIGHKMGRRSAITEWENV